MFVGRCSLTDDPFVKVMSAGSDDIGYPMEIDEMWCDASRHGDRNAISSSFATVMMREDQKDFKKYWHWTNLGYRAWQLRTHTEPKRASPCLAGGLQGATPDRLGSAGTGVHLVGPAMKYLFIQHIPGRMLETGAQNSAVYTIHLAPWLQNRHPKQRGLHNAFEAQNRHPKHKESALRYRVYRCVRDRRM